MEERREDRKLDAVPPGRHQQNARAGRHDLGYCLHASPPAVPIAACLSRRQNQHKNTKTILPYVLVGLCDSRCQKQNRLYATVVGYVSVRQYVREHERER